MKYAETRASLAVFVLGGLEPTTRFSVIDPHRMMQTCGLTDGFVLTGIIALTYG